MPLNKKHFDIARILYLLFTGIATDKERKELDDWLQEDENHRKIAEDILNPVNFKRDRLEKEHFPASEGWEKFCKKMGRKRELLKVGKPFLQYASILLIFLTAGLLYMALKTDEDPVMPPVSMSQSVSPGTVGAILTLNDGTQINIAENDLFLAKNNKLNYLDKGIIDFYNNHTENNQETLYNTIQTLKGNEISFQLADGSMVYLNAESKLTFPLFFGEGNRTVYLEGEAFFDVVKDKNEFIVTTEDMAVRVLGTSFNVSAYRDMPFTHTTLVEGSVCINSDQEKEIVLSPSEQAFYDKNTESFSVNIVNTSLYTSWKDGVFYFKDCSLEEIMNNLARWYDIDVLYKISEIKNIKFGCRLNRHENIIPILELLTATDKITATLEGKTIILDKK